MKQNKTILILGSYPIVNPQHGGQKRTEAIVKAYKQNFLKVKYCAIYPGQYYSDRSPSDIPVGRATKDRINRIPDFSDIYCGEALFEDPQVKKKVIQLITKFQPDIIDIEQPYVYLGLRPLLQELNLSPKLIYSSQNIEYEMKKSIFNNLGIDEGEKTNVINKILELEKNLSIESALVVAVSEEDAQEYKRLGAHNVIVAPNGINQTAQLKNQETKLAEKEGAYLITKKILFVGSAHSPNWIGFLKMVTNKLGFLPSDTRIYIVGGVSDYLAKAMRAPTIENLTFWQRAVACGRVSEKKLAELLSRADIIILPITEGGGSNLKTAEAFMANKKIVATSYAMRSYEYLSKMPNLFIADTPKEFRDCIVQALNTEFVTRSTKEEQLVQKVLWEYCLKSIAQEVVKL